MTDLSMNWTSNEGTYAPGKIIKVSVEMTRAANTTGYDANDVVAPAAGGLIEVPLIARANGGQGYLVAFRLSTDKKSITPRFRVHLFNASNPTLSADGAVWKELYADAAKRITYFDLSAMSTAALTADTDMSRAFDNSLRIPFVTGSGTRSIWVALETLDAFTPASGEKFTIMALAEVY